MKILSNTRHDELIRREKAYLRFYELSKYGRIDFLFMEPFREYALQNKLDNKCSPTLYNVAEKILKLYTDQFEKDREFVIKTLEDNKVMKSKLNYLESLAKQGLKNDKGEHNDGS